MIDKQLKPWQRLEAYVTLACLLCGLPLALVSCKSAAPNEGENAISDKQFKSGICESEIILSLRVKGDAENEFVLEFSNRSPNALRLDRQGLNPTLLCSVRTADGQPVYPVPISVPWEPSEADVLTLHPKESITIGFRLDSIIDKEFLKPGEYLIRCFYDTRQHPSAARLRLWVGRVESNEVRVTRR